MKQGKNGRGVSAPLPIPTRDELLAAGINIAISVPMERTVSDWAFTYFWQIAKRGWPLIDHVYARTDINRNRSGKWLRDNPEFTHVLMMDLDHLHAADIVERLASWVLEDRERLVVSGLHFRRAMPFEPMAFMFGKDGRLHAPIDWGPGLYEVHAVGHGSILIAREVFEMLPEPWWAYTYDSVEDNIFPSEDLWFSHICREAGIKLWVDTTVTSPHIVNNIVDEDTFRRYIAENPDIVQVVGEKKKTRVVKRSKRKEAASEPLPA
jgi:hypothetical protein